MWGQNGSAKRLFQLILSFGADIQQRGVYDYTPFHYAAAADDTKTVELPLSNGADPGENQH